MNNTFDKVSTQYQNKALVQQQAAVKLLALLKISGTETVLDVACGPGHITKTISALTSGQVIGVDISAGMIEQARKNYPELTFRQIAAADLDYANVFDKVFCNSSFQWFNPPEKATQAMLRALKPGGVLGIACPGTTAWSPWLQKIIPIVTAKPEIKDTFAHWRNPWVFLPDQKSYQDFFEKFGLKTKYISVDYEAKQYTIEEAYNIYLSGAANGFVGKQAYDIDISDEYVNKFNAYAKAEIEKLAVDGLVKVDFNRFYYVGVK